MAVSFKGAHSPMIEKRDQKAAKHFLTKAIGRNGTSEKINIDKSGANAAAIVSYNAEHNTTIMIRKCKYLNTVVEQDHRVVKRVTRPMMGFKSFEAAQSTLTGIELIDMLRKGQREDGGEHGLSAAENQALITSFQPLMRRVQRWTRYR